MSKRIRFTKMEGAGNDFIVVDNRRRDFPTRRPLLRRLCDRKRGIGSDGILLVEPSSRADFRMRFFNPDGGEVDMCGNGARCIARFAARLGLARRHTRFESRAGLIEAWLEADQVKIQLADPKDQNLFEEITLSDGRHTVHDVHTGVPHAVLFVRDLARVNVARLGAEIRYHKRYQPAGTNADFVRLTGKHTLAVRTYERGVEGETDACGTGVVASAIAAHFVYNLQPPLRVLTRGGDVLEVDFQRVDTTVRNVTLKGPANFVFQGEITV